MSSEDENKPLLIKANPSWSGRRAEAAGPSSNGPNDLPSTTPQLQRCNSEDVARPRDGHSKPIACYNIQAALVFILLAVVLERVTFYGLTGNLVLFLNESPFEWESYYAMNALFVFLGISYIMSLIGGWMADSCLGRFKAMLLAYAIYIAGFVFLPIIAPDNDKSSNSNLTLPNICAAGNSSTKSDSVDSPFEESCAWLIFICLLVIAIGAGALKANICPFGSDQLVRATQQTQLSFFNWFYWCVNLGSFIGLGVLTYIEQQHSFFKGYLACLVSLCVSAFVFIIGRCVYTCRPADGSVLTNIVRIIREAWRRKRERRQLQLVHRKSICEGTHTDVDTAPVVEGKIDFLDHAKTQHGGIFHKSLVDDVKKLGIILAVFAVLIPYWLVYFQMQTTFLVQGLHMKLSFATNVSFVPIDINGSHHALNISDVEKPKLVAAWFSLFDAVFVIILLPLFDRVIYPWMARKGYPFNFSKRIVLGMVFAILSMIAAGVVEHFRLKAFWAFPNNPCSSLSIYQRIGPNIYYAANMSVLWQIPQYALIGISEVFASVACLQFAVSVAPKSMKTIITGLFYLFSGIGSLLGLAIVSGLAASKVWFHSHDAGNINCRPGCKDNYMSYNEPSSKDCHLDYFFYFLAAFEFLGLLLFLLVARKFKLNFDEIVLYSRAKEDTRGETRNKHVQRRYSSVTSP